MCSYSWYSLVLSFWNCWLNRTIDCPYNDSVMVPARWQYLMRLRQCPPGYMWSMPKISLKHVVPFLPSPGFTDPYTEIWASLVAQLVRKPPAMQETLVQLLVGKIPWRRDRLSTPVFLDFPVAQMIKNPSAMWETWVQSLGWADPLEEGMQPTPVLLPGESLWTEEPNGLQSMQLQRVGHDWVTKYSTHANPRDRNESSSSHIASSDLE